MAADACITAFSFVFWCVFRCLSCHLYCLVTQGSVICFVLLGMVATCQVICSVPLWQGIICQVICFVLLGIVTTRRVSCFVLFGGATSRLVNCIGGCISFVSHGKQKAKKSPSTGPDKLSLLTHYNVIIYSQLRYKSLSVIISTNQQITGLINTKLHLYIYCLFINTLPIPHLAIFGTGLIDLLIH